MIICTYLVSGNLYRVRGGPDLINSIFRTPTTDLSVEHSPPRMIGMAQPRDYKTGFLHHPLKSKNTLSITTEPI